MSSSRERVVMSSLTKNNMITNIHVHQAHIILITFMNDASTSSHLLLQTPRNGCISSIKNRFRQSTGNSISFTNHQDDSPLFASVRTCISSSKTRIFTIYSSSERRCTISTTFVSNLKNMHFHDISSLRTTLKIKHLEHQKQVSTINRQQHLIHESSR